MLQRPAALLSDVSARLWSSGNGNNNDNDSNNDGESNSASSAATSVQQQENVTSDVGKKKRFSYPSALLERFSHRNSAATTSSTTAAAAAAGGSSTHHSANNAVPHISIAPTTHRENTAFHALKDTFYLPSPWTFLPALPTIPCMSGLGQSNLFTDSPSTDTNYYPGDLESPHESHSRNASSRRRRGSNEDENITHHQKAGALFTTGNKHDSFKKLEGSNVLMLGGYRGSILRDANTGRRLWVPLKVGFNVRKAELAIGLTGEDELRSESKPFFPITLPRSGRC
jgi:hypothetical protein